MDSLLLLQTTTIFPSPDDFYRVTVKQIKLLDWKTGDAVEGTIRPPQRRRKHISLLVKVSKINTDLDPALVRDRIPV